MRWMGLALVALLAGTARAEPVALRVAAVGSPPSMQNMYLHIAFEEGFFAKNGLTVDKLLQLRAGPLATQAVTANQVDVTETDAEGVLNAVAAGGADLLAVAAPAQRVSYVIAVSPDITDLKALVGKPFAISRPGALSQYLVYPALEAAGIDRKSIIWVSIGGASERRIALAGARVKAALLHLDFALQAERDAGVKTLMLVAPTVPGYPHEMLVVRAGLARSNPDAVTALVRSVMEACRFITSHRERTVEIYRKYSGEEDAVLAGRAYDALIAMHGFGVNGGMTREGLQLATDLAVKNGGLAEAPKLEAWADFRFQDAALAQIGRVAD